MSIFKRSFWPACLLFCAEASHVMKIFSGVRLLMSKINADYQLDTIGLNCPEPVMMLHNKIRDVGAGETILVLASDPSTERDVPKFCKFLGHELMNQIRHDNEYHYLIKKKTS